MIRVWDGFLSAICAVITLALIGTPLWAAVSAVRASLVPAWVWAPIVLMAFVGVVMIAAFARKAVRGIDPLRERRR